MHLHVRPLKQEGESTRGYIWRLAALNGLNAAEKYQEIASSVPHAITPSSLQFNPENLNPRYRLFAHFRYCPSCWNDGAYFRQEWDLALLPVCPKHLSPLIQLPMHLPSIIWKEKYATGSIKERLNKECLEIRYPLVRVLREKVFGFAEAEPNGLLSLFKNMDANEVFSLVLLFGAYGKTARKGKPRKVCFKSNVKIALQLFDSAARVFVSWPTSLEKILPCPVKQNLANRRVLKEYSYFLSAVGKELRNQCFGEIKQDIYQHVLSTWPEAIDLKTNWVHCTSKRMNIPGATVSAYCGVSLSVLKSWIKRKVILGSVRYLASGKEQVTIPKSEINRINVLKTSDLASVSKAVEIPKSTLRALIKLGIIEAFKSQPGSPWVILPESLEIFRRSIVSKAKLKRNTADLMSIDEASRFYCDRAHHQWDIYQAIYTGQLCVYRLNKRVHLISKELFLRKNDLTDWQRAEETISIPQLAERLHIKQEVAYHLVAMGLIDVLNYGRQGRFVTEVAMAQFVNDYVFLRELAKIYSTSSTALLHYLASLNVHPVTGPSVDGSRQYVMKRASLPDSWPGKLTQRH